MPRTVAIVSPGYDALWFAAPGVVSAALALVLGLTTTAAAELSLLGWVVLVMLIDVGHVWATMFRTYLDPIARARHRRKLWLLPACVAWFGFLLHLESPSGFWRALAYLASFHFIKQHVGFALLYVRKGGETPFDRRLTAMGVWAGTGAPLLWWHANLPREFAWFVDDDFVAGLPAAVGTIALVLGAIVLMAFSLRRAALWKHGHKNPMVAVLVLLPALNWHLGIVVFNDDRIFTITNVVTHGVPYLALVWATGGRQQVSRWLPGTTSSTPALVLYAAALSVAAFAEEALWDRWIWHDHAQLFGHGSAWAYQHPVITAAVVAVLTLPQATHYLFDRFVWRLGPQNPELTLQLLGEGNHTQPGQARSQASTTAGDHRWR